MFRSLKSLQRDPLFILKILHIILNENYRVREQRVSQSKTCHPVRFKDSKKAKSKGITGQIQVKAFELKIN